MPSIMQPSPARAQTLKPNRGSRPGCTGRPALARHRHSHRDGHALAKRPGRSLHAAGPSVLGVPGALGAELAERLEVVERDRGPAEHLIVRIDRPHGREMQERPQQRRHVTFGQDETVPVGPDRVAGIKAQVPLPERVGDRRHAKRSSRMARAGPLDGVDAQAADRVHAQCVEVSCDSRHAPLPGTSARGGERSALRILMLTGRSPWRLGVRRGRAGGLGRARTRTGARRGTRRRPCCRSRPG